MNKQKKVSTKSKFIGYKLKLKEFLKKFFFPMTIYYLIKYRFKLKNQISKLKKIINEESEFVDLLISKGFWIENDVTLQNIQVFKLDPNFNENMNIRNMIENINMNVSNIFNVQFSHLKVGHEYHIVRDTDYKTYHTISMIPHYQLDVNFFKKQIVKSAILFVFFISILSIISFYYKPLMNLFVL